MFEFKCKVLYIYKSLKLLYVEIDETIRLELYNKHDFIFKEGSTYLIRGIFSSGNNLIICDFCEIENDMIISILD